MGDTIEMNVVGGEPVPPRKHVKLEKEQEVLQQRVDDHNFQGDLEQEADKAQEAWEDTRARVEMALEALGFEEPTPEMVGQFMVMCNALYIYYQKDGAYGGAWRRLGALNNLTRASTKTERLLETFWHQERFRTAMPDMDDAFDLINYMVFFIRQAMQGQWTRG